MIYDNKLYTFEIKVSIEELPNELIKIDTPKENNSHVVKFLALPPKFDLISTALENATFINHINEQPFIVTSIFYRNIFTKAIRIIDFEDYPKISQIVVDKIQLSDVNYNLVKLICKEWHKNVL